MPSGLPTAALPGGVTTPATTSSPLVTNVGGPGPPVSAVGSHSDSSDLYGIVLVLAVIVVAIFAARSSMGSEVFRS